MNLTKFHSSAVVTLAFLLAGCGGTVSTPAPTPPPVSQIQVNYAPTPTEASSKAVVTTVQPTAALAAQITNPTAVSKPVEPPASNSTANSSSSVSVPIVSTPVANKNALLPPPGQPPFAMPDRIIIPKIKIDAPVKEARIIINKQGQPEWFIPPGRVGAWHNNSSLLGQTGNIVLNGHNNIEGAIFAGLYDLKPGDTVILRNKFREVTYELTYYKLLKEKGEPISVLIENAKLIEPTDDDRITLVTCWPHNNNTHRWIWVGKPVNEKIFQS
jgi:sortase A